MNADERAALIASRQRGLLSTADVRRAGLTSKQVVARVRTRGWRRPARGLLALPGAPRSDFRQDAMAAVLLAGPAARATHLTACALHGVLRAPTLPHVTVPPQSSTRTRLTRIHRSLVPAVDRATVDGIPTTSLSRAIVDAASLLDGPGLEALVDEALCAGLASVASIRAALGRAGRVAGAPLLRDVLLVWSSPIRPGSPAEVRLLRRLRALGVNDAVTQFELRDSDGLFVARFDVAIPARRHALEYDSDRWHNPRHVDHDEQRLAWVESLGWRVDTVTKHDLLPSSTRLADLLATGDHP